MSTVAFIDDIRSTDGTDSSITGCSDGYRQETTIFKCFYRIALGNFWHNNDSRSASLCIFCISSRVDTAGRFCIRVVIVNHRFGVRLKPGINATLDGSISAQFVCGIMVVITSAPSVNRFDARHQEIVCFRTFRQNRCALSLLYSNESPGVAS